MSRTMKYRGPQKCAKKSAKNGVALMIVLVALAFMSVISFELIASSTVDLNIARNARDRMQAYYLAQSAARLSILRLALFKELENMNRAGGAVSVPKDLVARVWSFPLPAFPPPFRKDVDWPGVMQTTIMSEGSRIPINLLDGKIERGSSPEMAQSVRDQLLQVFQQLLEDEDFEEQFGRDLDPEFLVNRLVDWIDTDESRIEGGDESADYDKQSPPVFPRNDRILSLSELHMINGWTDELVQRVRPHLSVLNNNLKINPNVITLERIRLIEPKLTPQELLTIQTRRMEQPFNELADLENFIRTNEDIRNGREFAFPEGTQSQTSETIFMIRAVGIVNDARRQIELGVRFNELEEPKQDPGQGPGGQPGQSKQKKLSSPLIVFVKEQL